MKKPILSNYSYIPNYTAISTCYDYEKYSNDLNVYIKYLEGQVKKLTIPDVSISSGTITNINMDKNCYTDNWETHYPK